MIASLLFINTSYAEQCTVETHFTPQEKLSEVVVNRLKKAHESVYLSVYGIQNQLIADALIQLHQRGVVVQVNVDKLQATGRTSKVAYLRAHGVPVLVKKASVPEHNKFLIVDYGRPEAFVLMGSWNFSNSADKQDNSAAILSECPGVIESFKQTFDFISRRDGAK
jgi:phosphatidylserine/phosphatidylglycerophosphate/cardiolipin synthase-like enzyme